MSESDGLDEVVEAMLRTGLTAAGRIGEELSRAREQRLRVAQAADEQQGRELHARLEAERAAARAQLTPALDNRWWDTAKVEEIVRVYETATAWQAYDPMAHSAAEAVAEQVQRRYSVDHAALGAGTSAAATLNEAERTKNQAQEERTSATDENAEAAQLLAEAERTDKARRNDVQTENARPEQLSGQADATYDSAERREALAKGLDHVADREAVQARINADRDQATPPTAAVAPARQAPTARKRADMLGTAREAQKDLGR